MIQTAIQKVVEGETLTRQESAGAMDAIMTGEATGAQIGSLVTALRMRGESHEEIAGFVDSMRRHALRVPLDDGAPVVDTCGTGGDGSHTFNISTTAAFVVAGAGVRVAKHGNRAMSSRCGSADVLEGLGIRIALSPEQVGQCISEAGIGFMFAQVFHPAMRYAAPARREIGVRTVFNILGPLTNPAGAQHQVVGVANAQLAEKIAGVLGVLGTTHSLVVHSRDGLDELAISAENFVSDVRANGSDNLKNYTVTAVDLGLEPAPLESIQGGSVEDNVAILRHVLGGGDGATRTVTVLNAAAAIYAADAAPSIQDAVALAVESIDSGAAMARLEDLQRLTSRMGEA